MKDALKIVNLGVPTRNKTFEIENVLVAIQEAHLTKLLVIGQSGDGQFKFCSSTGDRTWMNTAVERLAFELTKL